MQQYKACKLLPHGFVPRPLPHIIVTVLKTAAVHYTKLITKRTLIVSIVHSIAQCTNALLYTSMVQSCVLDRGATSRVSNVTRVIKHEGVLCQLCLLPLVVTMYAGRCIVTRGNR